MDLPLIVVTDEMMASWPPDAQAVVRLLLARNAQLEARVAELEAQVARLQARLNKNSSNSSKPPSSDGPQVKPAPPKAPSGKKRGGQPGHPRHERVMLPADHIIDHKPPYCACCQAKLTGEDTDPIVEQVIDLPEKLRVVTHHRRHTLECPRCHTRTTAQALPEAVGGFGIRLQATVAYLSGVGRLSKRTIRTLFDEVCDIPMSLGSISKLEAKTSEALAPIHDETLREIQGLDANVDETGWKQGIMRVWLWVAVTTCLTVFLIRLKRNRDSLHDLVGPQPGIVTSDRHSAYVHLSPEHRQICWAHLRRDFQAMIDRKNAGSDIGRDLLAHADILFDHWQNVRDGTRTRGWFDRTYACWLREQVRLLLQQGEQCSCQVTAGVCRMILKVEVSLWTFARVSGVEPTNNAAERAVRHAVCWRKTSLGTDSERGSRFVERILTVAVSCRTQNRSVIAFLTQAIQGKQPSLLCQPA
jgi:transposase